MSDINTNISVNIDTSNALGQLKALQRQISTFHSSIAKSSQTASLAQADLQKNFLNAVNGIGAFSAELRTVKTSAENFTSSLEKNKFSMREYFRYAGGSTKTFGKLFKTEFDTINKVARENVKDLQTQYIKMGRDANGAMKAIAVRPLTLDMQNLSTQTQIAAQKQALFNQLIKQGSTNLLNFGKNTQWAGRQLMVGFTLPLLAVGSAASKTFMDMEAQAIKFKKVYGDLFTAPEETKAALDGITELAQGFTKYGIAVSKTVGLAADAAAAGFAGVDLQRQTTAATRLSVLGQIDQQKALETTISLQNALAISSEDLGSSIDFLNAVENQTVTSLDDITIAIPKVAPVIKSLGGDVKDLAFFLTAMKEGGINASEGANALKSGLASMINPSNKARGMLESFGISIDKIVDGNAGDLKATVVEFSNAVNSLKPLDRARVIEQMFGKFQFARLSTLFQNVTKDGTQAARVLDLAGSSVQDLAALSEKELGMTADSAMNKFKKSVEDLKFALVPVGQIFLEVITPFLEKISGLIEKFNGLSDSTKKIVTLITVGLGAIAPVILMTIGLLANFVANGIKGLMILRNGYLRLTGQSQILGEQTSYLTLEQRQALAAAHSLEQSHARLTQAFTVESTALGQLKNAYIGATTAANNFAMKNPGMMVAPVVPTKRATGKPAVVGGTGNRDTELALLTPGETVIPEPMSEKYGSLINGMIADNIPGYGSGKGSIAEEFLSTRAGRNASGGEKSQVNIPGGYQLGHFAPAVQMTGAMLQELARTESAKFQATVANMIESVGGNLDHLFDVFTNEVTVQSQAFNQALGEVGSGNESPITMFRNEAVAGAGAYNAPLIAKMKEAGSSTESIDNAVTELAREFDLGITGLGTVTTVTAEEVNRITEEAYRKVSEVNDDVRRAREELSNPGALKEISGVASGRTPFASGYNTKGQRTKVNEVVQEQLPGVYPTQQAFNFTGEAARKVGVQNAIAIREVFNSLSQEAKTRVIALLGDIDAMSQQVILEAQDAGIDLGKYAIRGITEGIEGQSPSRAARREGQKVVDGFEQGILEGMDDASLAASKVSNAATDSLATPAVVTRSMGKGRGASRPQGPVPIGPVIPTGASLLPIIAAPIVKATEGLGNTIGLSESRLASLNKSLNSVSFGLTAAAGAGSMFGGKIGDVSQQIFKYSGLMFGLMQITQLLTQAQVARLVAERAATAGILTRTVSEATGAVTFTRVSGLFAGGIKKFIPNLLKFAQKIVQIFGPWGKLISVVIAAGFAFKKIKDYADAQREKVDGLGNAAFIAGERLKTLGDIFGVIPQKFAFESLPKTVGVGMTGQQRTAVDKVREAEDFQKNFGKDINAIKGATDQQAELLFRGLVVQLKGRGFAQEQVEAIVNAIKIESGKTDVKIDFASISILTPEGRKDVQKDIISLVKLAKTTREIKALSGTLAGVIGATQQAFADGAISAQDYADQMTFINTQIASMPQPLGMIATEAIFRSMDSTGVLAKTASAITSVKDRLLVLNAIALAGLGPDSPLIKGLASTDLLMQDISRRGINKAITDGMSQITIAAEAAKDAAEKLNGSTNGGQKGLSALSKKVIEGLKKELKLLEDKRKALEDVNNEIERQQEFQNKQRQLDADMVQAKISGNYIQAALLGQQKLYNKSQYDRETSEIKLDRQIQKLQDRIDALENGAKVTDLDKKLSNIENKVSSATKSAAKSSGTTKTPAKDNKAAPTPTPQYAPEKPQKPIPSYLPALNGVIKKRGPVSSYTVAFDPTSGTWKEVKIGSIPKNYITKEQWSRGTKTYSTGGKVLGPGTATSDSIPAMLSDGEYVLSAKAVNNAGGPGVVEGFHNALRRAKGGPVSSVPHSMGMSSFGAKQTVKPKPEKKRATSLFDKSIWESTANFFGLSQMAKTGFDMAKYGGPDKMLIARLLGAPMKSSIGDNATTALNVVPIPVAKALKPLLKILPNSLKTLLAKNGIGKISTRIDESSKSIYKREDVSVGEEIFPTYKIGNKQESFIFQGYKENVSSLSKSGVTAVETTPEGLLSAALGMSPKNKNISTMLDNFKNNKLGQQELTFLDDISAAVSINSKGIDPGVEKTDGFAMVLAALSGDKNAKKIIDYKRKKFYELVENAKASNKSHRDSMEYKPKEGPIDTGSVPVIHSTGHPVIRDKNGDVVLHPYGDFNIGGDKAVPRGSLHTTLYAPVESHLMGQWDASQTRIVSSLENMKQANGLPYNVNATDTWWQVNPGQGLRVPNPSIVRTFKDSKSYREELIKRGLIQTTEMTPPVAIDSALKEVLHIQREAYSPVERLQISRLAQDLGLSRNIDPGQETQILQDIALQYAKQQQGVDPYKARLEQWGLNNEDLNQHIYRIAQQFGVDGGIHSGSHPELLEKILMRESNSRNQNGITSFSKLFVDSLESIRMATRHGRFKTEIEKIKDPYDEFANGGYVSNKIQMPRFAIGGLVKNKISASNYTLPSYDVGIGYVPEDQIAQLHKGERVLTAEENKNFSTTGAVTNNIYINGSDLNKKEIAQAVMVELDRAQKKNNKTNMVAK